MLGLTLTDRVRNDQIRRRTGVDDIRACTKTLLAVVGNIVRFMDGR